MKTGWLFGSFLITSYFVLTMIIFGQKQMMYRLSESDIEQLKQAEILVNALNEKIFVRDGVKNTLSETAKSVDILTDEVGKLTPGVEQKKNQHVACKAGQTKTIEDLARVQKDYTDTEAKLKLEKDALATEIASLKQSFEQRSKMCDFVKDNTTAVKLCGTTH